MSWWNEHINQAVDSPFVIGGIAAVATSLFTTYKRNPKMHLLARLSEAFTCALISLGLTKAGVLYLGLSPDWALPIGVFCSWIGTDSLKQLLTKLIKKYVTKEEEKSE